MQNRKMTAIFGNSRGVILNMGSWAHYYKDAQQAAEDWMLYAKTSDTSQWEGNEPVLAQIQYRQDEGYQVYTKSDIDSMMEIVDIAEIHWDNVRQFVDCCRKIGQ